MFDRLLNTMNLNYYFLVLFLIIQVISNVTCN